MERLPWVLRDPVLRAVLVLAGAAGVVIGLVIPFLTLTARDRGVSLGAIGVMASSYLVVQMLLQLPMGTLSDRIGRVVPIAAGLLVEAIATAGFALADRPWSFIALRALQGVGVAILYPAFRALIADVTPVDRRGQAYAGVAAAFSGGMLVGPPIGGLIAGITGSSGLFVLAGALEVPLAFLTLVVLRGAGRPGQGTQESERVPFATLLALPLVGAFLLSFAGQIHIGLFSGIWSIYLDDLGASDLQIGLSFTTFSLSFMLLAPLGGRLADRGQRWRQLLAANLALSGVILVYGFGPSVVAVLLLGLVEGAIVTMAQPALDAYLASVADPRIQGRIQGAFATVGMAGAAISALLGSILYGYGLMVPFATGGATLALLTLIAVTLIRRAEQGMLVGAPIGTVDGGAALAPAGAPDEALVPTVAIQIDPNDVVQETRAES